MKLIVGLGNPGKKYEHTRHNVGFEVIDEINKQFLNLDIKTKNFKLDKKFKAEILEAQIGTEKMILAKPQTFMNLSGEAVQALASFYKINPEDIWVISDDINLDLGSVRVRQAGSAGGHNGLKSIINQLGTENFVRFRVGVGSNLLEDIPAEKYVLAKFAKNQQELVAKTIDKTAVLVIESITNGIKEETLKIN